MQNFNYKQQHSSWKKNSYLIYQNDLWKKKRRKKILLTKKPHVFGLSIFNIYCNKQIISKEKKNNTTNIGWDIYSRLFNWPLIQTTGVESLSAQINMMISSSFTPFFWNPTFFFFSFFQSFRIIFFYAKVYFNTIVWLQTKAGLLVHGVRWYHAKPGGSTRVL